MIRAEIQTDGSLKVTADNESRREIAEGMRRDYWGAFADTFEPYSANGSYAPFDAGQANPFVGLTSAICIAESMDIDDDGTATVVGRLWYYASGYTADPLEDLARRGRTVFALAG